MNCYFRSESSWTNMNKLSVQERVRPNHSRRSFSLDNIFSSNLQKLQGRATTDRNLLKRCFLIKKTFCVINGSHLRTWVSDDRDIVGRWDFRPFVSPAFFCDVTVSSTDLPRKYTNPRCHHEWSTLKPTFFTEI